MAKYFKEAYTSFIGFLTETKTDYSIITILKWFLNRNEYRYFKRKHSSIEFENIIGDKFGTRDDKFEVIVYKNSIQGRKRS